MGVYYSKNGTQVTCFGKKKLKERKIKIPVEACEWMIEGNRPQIGHHIESNLQPLTYF